MKKNYFTVGFLMLTLVTGCVPQMNHLSDTIILATYNIRYPGDKNYPFDWKTRIPLIREVIFRTGMDIAGLQEPVDFQLQAILENTTFKSIGSARNDFKRDGEFSCIIFNSRRFDVLKSGTFGLSEKPDIPGYRSWNSSCPRIATWGLFLDKRTGKKFLMYNTHLDHKSELARIKSIELIAGHARNNNTANLPMVLTGDFNAGLDSATVKYASSQFMNALSVSETEHKGMRGSFHKWGTLPEHRVIDYILKA